MVLTRIGLTGASGMVGHHVMALLAQEGIACRATSRHRPEGVASAEWLASDMADWRNPTDLDALFGGVDAIVHAGALIPEGEADGAALLDINVRACLILGQWALSRGKPLLFLSSCSVYGETCRRLAEDAPYGAQPLGGLYGFSKVLAEQTLGYLARQGLTLAVIRPTAVYGWGMSTNKLVAAWAARARRGEAIALAPPFADRVNLLHAHDLARGILAALKAGAVGTFNIRGPQEVSMENLAEACVQVAGRGEVCRQGADDPGHVPLSRFLVDGGAAERVFGYGPVIGLKDGLSLLAAKAFLPCRANGDA